MSDFNQNNPDMTPVQPEAQPNVQPIPPQQAMGQPVTPPPPPPPPPPYMEQMPHPQSTMAPYQQPPQYQQAPQYQQQAPQYQPYQPQPTDSKKPMAIAALILGIVSVLFSCFIYLAIPCGIISIILGAISAKSSARGMAIAGIVMGALGIFFSIAIILLAVVGIMGEAFGEFSDFYY